MKKLLSLVCVLALVCCSIPFAASAEEPVEITYFRPELNRTAVAYYSDTLWIKAIEEALNIKLTITGPLSEDDYYTVANAMLADAASSGNYPDLLYYDFAAQYPGGVVAAKEDGVVLGISENPEYKAAVSNWFDVIESNEEIRRTVTQEDGCIDTFCHYETNMARSAYWGITIRKDWLDRLGLEIPTTVDELHDVLVAFRDNDANGNGDPSDELPLGDCNWWGSVHNTLDCIAAAFTLKPNVIYRDPHNDTMTFWTEYNNGENFKAYVETMAAWYAEGLIDVDSISSSYDEWSTKITSDKVGCHFAFPDGIAAWEDGVKQTMLDNSYGNPDDVCIYGLVPLKGIDGKPYAADADNALVGVAGADQPTVITTGALKNGKVEKCLELINFLYSEEGSRLQNWGVEGISYTVQEDGSFKWTDLVEADADGYDRSEAVFKYALPTMGAWPKAMSYESWGAMNLVAPSQIIANQNYAQGDVGLDRVKFNPNEEELEVIQAVFTDITTRVGEVVWQVVTGVKPIEAIDDLLVEVEKMGIGDVVDAWNSAYTRFKD